MLSRLSFCLVIRFSICSSFTFNRSPPNAHTTRFPNTHTKLNQIPPEEWGYASAKDCADPMPEGYEPSPYYPGTMRPSMVRDNAPYEDLVGVEAAELDPAYDDESVSYEEMGSAPGNIAFPHLMDLPYYHVWGSPMESRLPMEEVIDAEGRWLSEEENEFIRKGQRSTRGARGSRAQALGGRGVVVIDEEGGEEEGEEEEEEEEEDDNGDNVIVSDAVDSGEVAGLGLVKFGEEDEGGAGVSIQDLGLDDDDDDEGDEKLGFGDVDEDDVDEASAGGFF
ncbi:hypothetical protein ScalyP_jg5625 [Parmales sp. scaly parma]|nr:hypothetical protein ScalyP_jg5625 [Parmales sp. scaly parma]